MAASRQSGGQHRKQELSVFLKIVDRLQAQLQQGSAGRKQKGRYRRRPRQLHRLGGAALEELTNHSGQHKCAEEPHAAPRRLPKGGLQHPNGSLEHIPEPLPEGIRLLRKVFPGGIRGLGRGKFHRPDRQ